MAQEQYVTSTGKVGVIEQRSHNRVGFTAEHAIVNSADLYTQVQSVFAQCPPDGGRAMWKGITTGDALKHATDHPDLSASLEVSIPLSTIGLGDQYFAIFGINDNERASAFSLDEHRDIQAKHRRRTPQKALDLIQRQQGIYTFHQDIPPELVHQFATLWGRFDWTEEQVENYAHLLQEQKSLPASQKTLWNIGLTNKEGLLEAAATAELFSLQQKNGKPVHFVELTEWASDKSGEGLIQAAAAHLVCQILADRGDQDMMIYAETNAANGAPSVGRHIGLDFLSRYPHNETHAGTLFANVPVVDGRRDLRTEHRDFYWMGLSKDARRKYYPAEDIQQVVSMN